MGTFIEFDEVNGGVLKTFDSDREGSRERPFELPIRGGSIEELVSRAFDAARSDGAAVYFKEGAEFM